MIYDVSAQFEEIINRAISQQIANLPLSYPCKVKKVQDDGVFVEIETMLNKDDVDVERIIPIMQSPYLVLPIKEGDLGIALNCSYLFEEMIEDNQIVENLPSTKENGLFFVPLVSKGGFKGKVGDTMLSSQDGSSKITLRQDQAEIVAGQNSKLDLAQEVVLASGSTIEVKGASATLGEILGDILDMLTNMNLDAVAGNGAPLNSPTLTSRLPQIIAKVQGNLK